MVQRSPASTVDGAGDACLIKTNFSFAVPNKLTTQACREMNSLQQMVVSVSTAIKVENVCLDDILTRHADRLRELEADDPCWWRVGSRMVFSTLTDSTPGTSQLHILVVSGRTLSSLGTSWLAFSVASVWSAPRGERKRLHES
jgi:hypothetical protein